MATLDPPKIVEHSFPEVITVEQLTEQGRKNLASNPQIVQKISSEAAKGAIHKEGKWVLDPGSPWPIEKLSTGRYKVTHMWGYFNLSLSVNIGLDRGTAKIIENSPTYFIVETYVDGVLTDAPFVFTLSKVISPQ